MATVFRVATTRAGQIAQEILGPAFGGRLVTDRYAGYNFVDVHRRQVCWAHLLRDLMGMTERDDVGAALAAEMLLEVDKMLEWWKRIRDGTLSRPEFRKLMEPVRARVKELLLESSTTAAKKTAGMCQKILDLEPALWTFVDVEGIEPTNNAAEQAVRPAVLWRKGSFGNDSETGSRFTERILTAIATVRQHQHSVLDYLLEACVAFRSGQPTPSLIAHALE